MGLLIFLSIQLKKSDVMTIKICASIIEAYVSFTISFFAGRFSTKNNLTFGDDSLFISKMHCFNAKNTANSFMNNTIFELNIYFLLNLLKEFL